VFAIVSVVLIAGAVIAVAAHYLLVGPKHPELAGEAPDTPRFQLWERVMHGVTLLSLLVLAGTGFAAVLTGGRLTGFPLLLHWIAAPFFALGMAAVTLLWAGWGRFEPFDIEWFRVFGGYLGGDVGEVPAGRFNAGQKVFFWLVAVLSMLLVASGAARMYPVFGESGQAVMLTVHRIAALLLVCSVIAHVYLGTLANPGTIQAMLTGRVSRRWAWAHHPVWARRIGLPAPAASPSSREDDRDPVERA